MHAKYFGWNVCTANEMIENFILTMKMFGVRCSVFIVCMSMWMGMNLYIPVLKNGTWNICFHWLSLSFDFMYSNSRISLQRRCVCLYVACMILQTTATYYVACEDMEWKLACMCCATVIHLSYAVCETPASLTFIDTYNHVYHCIGSNKWTTNRINVVYIHIIFVLLCCWVPDQAVKSIMCHCANANEMKILYRSGNSLFVAAAWC